MAKPEATGGDGSGPAPVRTGDAGPHRTHIGTVVVATRPKPKERPRFNTRTGRPFTPSGTRKYEQLIRDAWVEQTQSLGFPGPVEVTMRFCFQRPKCHTTAAGRPTDKWRDYMTNTPDMDNLEKAVLDALNHVAFLDDKQVVDKLTVKHWGDQDCVEVSVWGLT